MSQLSRQAALKLSQEAMAFSDWTTVRDFASQIYGENRAARVEIETHEHYDDENYSYPIGAITAYDGNGNEITPDYSLPFFQVKQWRGPKSNEGVQGIGDSDEESFFDLFEYLSMPEQEKRRGGWVLFDDLPVHSEVYDLTSEPSLSLPTQEAASWQYSP